MSGPLADSPDETEPETTKTATPKDKRIQHTKEAVHQPPRRSPLGKELR